ncbi:hypothetical protein EJ05DRAFT_478258 [Pseudovirgaria hyperparasitica]|uniref:Uncharacterized protein n=1 Tax=Pseudovirgaria hyperparasitica TaxID=470096 RepID=A0A6A6W2A6_9PEZI|nr:uncharacterized protein EJ05DRAFT_478258 [Pseudovirgaria hyperparasitica]KAF2756249.1 hypothetical protein EJ05DRAFT_478258 [Pseudovirgaria hyperparasitica]
MEQISSLMAQRDNYYSQAIAQESAVLARGARQDNKLMAQLADSSRKIATTSLRDAKAMKAISVVTMVFLPATFTATYFSTSFWNLRAGPGESVVSGNHWIYWVVTVILTSIVNISAYAWYRRNERVVKSLEEGKVIVPLQHSLKKTVRPGHDEHKSEARDIKPLHHTLRPSFRGVGSA